VLAQDPIPISEVRKIEPGMKATKVAGRITANPEFVNTAYIQDRTAGIAIYAPVGSPFKLNVKPGDSVIINNVPITEFQATTGQPGTGLLELDCSSSEMTFTVVPTPPLMPNPKATTVPLIGEGVEGQLVRIRRLRFLETGAFQGQTNYTVFDQQGNDLAVRIDGATNIAVNSLPIPSEEFDLVGVVGQFRGTYQIFPRSAEDVGLPPVIADTVKKSRTLDITSWNLEWFGSADTSQGPSDKNRQRRSIRQVMDSVQADIYALQEVLSDTAARTLTNSIKGSYAVLFTYEIPSTQKMCYLYNTAAITPISSGLAVNGGSQAWANGRFPYRLTFDARIDCKTKRYVVFNIHGKATDSATAEQDYNRRKTDAETFHAYLSDFYSDSSLIMVGDYNDVLTISVVDSAFASPYKVFVDDKNRWFSPTLALEERGLASYIGFNRNFLDHCFISADLVSSLHRTYLEAPQAYISAYSTRVSDHLPVTTRLFLSGTSSVQEEVAAAQLGVRVSPQPMTDHGMAEIVLEHSAQVRVLLVDAQGNSRVLLNESLAPQIRLLQIPTTELASGVYRLQVSIGDKHTSLPVVIAR
jgi:endonuclease/exonuclease/phosphatase family metal-dependent hydrolase